VNLPFLNRRDLLRIAPAVAAAAMTPAHAAGTKGRLRPALCAYSYREELKNKTLSYEDLIRIAADSGVDGLDATVYWMPEPIPNDGFLFSLKKTAYKHAVGIYSIAIRTDMCRPTTAEQNQEFEKVRQWVDVASKLGAGHIRVFGGVVPKGATEDQAATWASEVLKRSAEYAGKSGIILGLENHGGITDKAETIVRIVKAADSPWVGINLDTGNFRSNVFPQIAMCIPHAVNVQVKIDQVLEDGKRGPGDWNRVARMLVDGGYQGYMSLEYESKDAPGQVPPLLRKLSTLCRSMSA
jgi:L-ribulose-5-phosphate 3-epimerase